MFGMAFLLIKNYLPLFSINDLMAHNALSHQKFIIINLQIVPTCSIQQRGDSLPNAVPISHNI